MPKGIKQDIIWESKPSCKQINAVIDLFKVG